MTVKPKLACVGMSKKKDKALALKVKGGTLFAVCVKTIKKWAAEIPPPRAPSSKPTSNGAKTRLGEVRSSRRRPRR